MSCSSFGIPSDAASERGWTSLSGWGDGKMLARCTVLLLAEAEAAAAARAGDKIEVKVHLGTRYGRHITEKFTLNKIELTSYNSLNIKICYTPIK